MAIPTKKLKKKFSDRLEASLSTSAYKTTSLEPAKKTLITLNLKHSFLEKDAAQEQIKTIDHDHDNRYTSQTSLQFNHKDMKSTRAIPTVRGT